MKAEVVSPDLISENEVILRIKKTEAEKLMTLLVFVFDVDDVAREIYNELERAGIGEY